MNCAVCNAACEKKCSQCNTVYYCSREHQKQDWKTHKPNCHPYLTNGHQTVKNKTSLYYNASFTEHNCIANCFKTFSKTGEIILIAARDIEPGEHLSISYIDHVYGTAKRRRILQKHYHFSCKCARCVDPTELGSHFSSLKCQNRGCTGFVIPMDALEKNSDWKCTSCELTMLASQVNELIQYWDVKLKNLNKSTSVNLRRQLVKKCEILFHPNHYYLTAIKISLAELPEARYEASADKLPSGILVEILQYCQQLRDLLAKLVPADSGDRATILLCMVYVLSTLESVENCNKYRLSSVEYEKLYMEIYYLLRYNEGADCVLAAARLMLMVLKFKAPAMNQNESKRRESE